MKTKKETMMRKSRFLLIVRNHHVQVRRIMTKQAKIKRNRKTKKVQNNQMIVKQLIIMKNKRQSKDKVYLNLLIVIV